MEEEKVKANNIIRQNKILFYNPYKDVKTANSPFMSCAWVKTTEGVVLIDTMMTEKSGEFVAKEIKDPIKYIIYTHGHDDHIGGARAFLKDDPVIIANKYLVDRLDKYKMLAAHKAHISAVQFNIPEVVRERKYVYPTKTFLGEYTFKLGDKTFELYTTLGETDDICWTWVPELNAAFVGDLIIGRLPNVGNPWKPTRFALPWAKALEEIREKEPEIIFYGGAGRFIKGKRGMRILNDNIEVLYSLHDQVVDLINEGVHITELIHRVKIPEHLKKKRHLKPSYSRPEFFAFNVYRWYHGYFDDNPAHLLPRPEKEVMKEIFELIGKEKKIIKRAKELFHNGQAQLALEVLDVLLQANPNNTNARILRIELLEELGSQDYCLMSHNAWYYYIKKDKEWLEKNK